MSRFDLVGFDPRGVEESASVKCIPDATLDESFGYEPDPVSDAQFQGAVAISKKIASGCSAKFGDQLGLYSTEQTARDMDAIRNALAEPKLNYLGFSYGTLLGAVCSTAVDPTLSPVDAPRTRRSVRAGLFNNFAACATPKDCPVAPDARSASHRLRRPGQPREGDRGAVRHCRLGLHRRALLPPEEA
jgi:hypothetical protein